jgi:hypothetical protein
MDYEALGLTESKKNADTENELGYLLESNI